MPCLDADKFNLPDHGQDVSLALNSLMTVPRIQQSALGTVIGMIQALVVPKILSVNWVPYQPGSITGNAACFYDVSAVSLDKLDVANYRVTVTETIRAQVVHELVHCLDFHFYHYSLTHAPSSDGVKRRAPVVWLRPNGQLWREDNFIFPLQQQQIMSAHTAELQAMQALARKNSLLSKTQRALLMRQLDYAVRADKVHVEFTPNVAQCLAYLYQWGFTGQEKGLLKNPRSVALLIARMEQALTRAINAWHGHQHYTRRVGDVVKLVVGDAKLDQGYDGGEHLKDGWYRPPVPPKPMGLAMRGNAVPGRRVPPPVPPRPGRGV